jgi:hypothetical protein
MDTLPLAPRLCFDAAMISFRGDPLSIEDGVMFGRVEIDGQDVRAGITLEAFDILIERAGFDPERDLGRMTVSDLIEQLSPMIEAHLQTKHFRMGGEAPLIIDAADLTTH